MSASTAASMVLPADASITAAVRSAGVRSPGPVYVYDLDRLRARCRELEGIPLARKAIFFATMANDHPEILDCIRDRGHGVFVNSLRHLRLARERQFPPDRIIFAATNMTESALASVVDAGVRIILDSLGQLRRFCSLARPEQEVGLRLCVGSALDGKEIRQDPTYRFGLTPSELPAAVDLARRHGVRIVGAHSYFGTDLTSAETLADGLERLAAAADALPDLAYLDVGGGFGVGDLPEGAAFPVESYGRLAARIMAELERRRERPIELVLEPGRYLVASCGFFFVKVVDVKVRDDRIFVGTDGSVAIFPRPLVYPERAYHPCELVPIAGAAAVPDLPMFICGNTTYSRDFLARNVKLPMPRAGDSIVFHHAGAYCRSMITDFLGQERPSEVFVDPARPVPFDGTGSAPVVAGAPARAARAPVSRSLVPASRSTAALLPCASDLPAVQHPLHSFDEFSRLRAIVIGVASGANHPEIDASFENFFRVPADEALRRAATGPIPRAVVDEVEEDIQRFIDVLRRFEVEVIRPVAVDCTRSFRTPHFEISQLYSLMPRDCVLVVGDLFIETPSPERARYFETFAFRPFMEAYAARGAHAIAAPKPILGAESYRPGRGTGITEAETLFDAANCVRLGLDIFIDVNHTANRRAVMWLERTLRGLVDDRIRVHPMSLGYDHVDVTLVPLRPGVILVDPQKVTEQTIPEQFRRWDRVIVDEVMPVRDYGLPYPLASNDGIGRNVLALSPDTLVVDEIQRPLIQALERRRFTVIPLPYRHGRTLGGSWHCITLDTHRDGELTSYFH